ncbi:hypothetical protein ACK3TF_001659 [Chlorella vulgaris]
MQVAGFSSTMRGTAVQTSRSASARAEAPRFSVVAAATYTKSLKVGQKAPKPAPPPPRKAVGGTKSIRPAGKAPVGKPDGGGTKQIGGTKFIGGTRKNATSIEVFSKDKIFRSKQGANDRPTPKILGRIEQLKLLSKLEKSGLLSLAERNGVTLSKLEKSGLLSTAEGLGVVSLLGDRNFPGTLYALATALLVAGPAAVYFLPDDSTGLVALQAVIALVCIAGGSAAWGGASLLSSLQKS